MRKLLVWGLITSLAWPALAFAGSPEGPGLGARALSMGGAFIGLADDWTAMYWNPAGLAQQKTAGGGFTVDFPTAHTKDGDSMANPILGQQNNDQKDTFRVPSAAYPAEPAQFNKTRFTNDTLLPGLGFYFPLKGVVIGVSSYQPLGYSSDWADNLNYTTAFGPASIGAHSKTLLSVTVVNFSVAKEIVPTFSLGAGVNFLKGSLDQYSRKNNVNTNPTFSYSMEKDLQTQGQAVEGTAGFLFQPTEEFSIGGVYRTGAQMDLEGNQDINWSGNPALDVLDINSGVRKVVNFPATYGIGLAFRPTSNWVLTADWQRTEWDEMRTELWYQSATNLNTSSNDGWRNTDRWRLGTEYKPFDEGLALRAGYYLDPSAIPDKALSSNNVVEVDREAVTMGVGYEWEHWQLDLTYLYTWGSTNVYGVDYEKTVNSIQTAISYRFN